ncbi:MAG TPA: hypothetical protein PLY93_06115 [Turneriella sp.]|nr:hypothetical protein [Turneriella sp.]
MATVEKNNSEKTSASDWLSFWGSIQNPNRMTLFIGFVVLMFFTVFLGYFGMRTLVRSFDYYRISFEAPFIEDIRPGTKIRYQGALEIGEVVYMKSSASGHRIVAKIRDDFHIPKIGSRASLSSWGYFGAKFINIEVMPTTFNQDFYTLDTPMPLEKIINSTIMFQQYYDAIKSEGGELSVLEKRLSQLKKTVLDIKKTPYVERHRIRSIVRNAASTTTQMYSVVNSTSADLYKMLKQLNDASEYLVYDLNKNLPSIKAKMDKFEQSVTTDGQSFTSRLLHEETIYYLLLDYVKFTNEKLNDMASAPYRIFFNQ